jgi:hypothetical protein
MGAPPYIGQWCGSLRGVLVIGALVGLPIQAIADPDCDETEAPAPGEDGAWGPLWMEDSSGALTPSISIVALGDSELWVEGRLSLGSESPIRWTQGPYNALSGAVPLSLPSRLGLTLAALRVQVIAKDPQTGAVRAVRAAPRVYVHQVGSAVIVLPEEEARQVAGLSEQTGSDGLVEDGLVGREVTP